MQKKYLNGELLKKFPEMKWKWKRNEMKKEWNLRNKQHIFFKKTDHHETVEDDE